MHISINPPALTPVSPAESSPFAPAQSAGASSFHDVLSGAIGEVESARSSADQSVSRFLSGEGDDLHSTILASQRADLEFQMFLQVRNKVVSAYQEVMRMAM
jgi:flagellar hook-basal body complex protein FliE